MKISKEEAIADLKYLSDLEIDILTNGPIKPDTSSHLENCFVCEEDRPRLKHLDTLMEKYTYGWYIATGSIINQINSICRLKIYIMDLIK